MKPNPLPRFQNKIVSLITFVLIFQCTMQMASPASLELHPSVELKSLLEQAVQTTLEKFKDKHLKESELAATVVDLSAPTRPAFASFRGDARIYPASVIKLFYLHAAHRWMEDGKIQDTPELRRAIKDMIVDSYNEATHYILDLLTETTSGPEL